MSSQFYQELARLDLGIADRWKNVTNDNIKFVINDRAAFAILDPVLNISGKNLKTHKITRDRLMRSSSCWKEPSSRLGSATRWRNWHSRP